MLSRLALDSSYSCFCVFALLRRRVRLPHSLPARAVLVRRFSRLGQRVPVVLLEVRRPLDLLVRLLLRSARGSTRSSFFGGCDLMTQRTHDLLHIVVHAVDDGMSTSGQISHLQLHRDLGRHGIRKREQRKCK